MKITNKEQAIHTVRDDGTNISYYIFPEYEVHYGELPPGVVQPWHHHAVISETLYILEGKLTLHYLDEHNEKRQTEVIPGDMIQVEDTPHTFSNPYKETCKMIAFRFVPQGIDQHEVIKNDKVLYPELE